MVDFSFLPAGFGVTLCGLVLVFNCDFLVSLDADLPGCCGGC